MLGGVAFATLRTFLADNAVIALCSRPAPESTDPLLAYLLSYPPRLSPFTPGLSPTTPQLPPLTPHHPSLSLLLLFVLRHIIPTTSLYYFFPAKPIPPAHKKNQLCKTNPISLDFASKSRILPKNKPKTNPIKPNFSLFLSYSIYLIDTNQPVILKNYRRKFTYIFLRI